MFCETEAEAFADPARELIFEVAGAYLERRGITAAELVFDPAQHRALLDDGPRFQEILQRIALLQGQHTRRPVSERMKELTALAEAAMQRVEAQAALLPDVAGLDEALQQKLLTGSNFDEWVRAGVAFVRLLKAGGGWAEQAGRCLDVIDAGVAGEVGSMADQTLSEILRLKPAAAAIFGENVNRRAMIEFCVSLLEARPAASDNLTPVMMRLQQTQGLALLPLARAAIRARLAEMLGGSMPLFHPEPLQEWERLLALKLRIAAIGDLIEDERVGAALARRFARFATPDLLNPILAGEPEIARKLLFLLRLYRELADASARFELLGVLGHYLEHRDFKTQFVSPQSSREDFASLAAGISSELMQADIPDQRKATYLQLFRNQLAAVTKPTGQRNVQRGLGGAQDYVLLQGQRIPLRNWSPVGLQFGPCSAALAAGAKLPVKVIVQSAGLSFEFRATAEVLRVADGLVAARYQCEDPAVTQKIKAYFA